LKDCVALETWDVEDAEWAGSGDDISELKPGKRDLRLKASSSVDVVVSTGIEIYLDTVVSPSGLSSSISTPAMKSQKSTQNSPLLPEPPSIPPESLDPGALAVATLHRAD
jgi:hypothetical protein